MTREARDRRQSVVVLFADLADSTALGESLDPEALREVLDHYFGICRPAVERHGGVVEKFIGDAVMAVFGVPAIHEDDAMRAVRAADEIRHAVAEANSGVFAVHRIELGVRIGIAAGQAMVSGVAHGDLRVVGDATNTASRLQTAARPGEVILSSIAAAMVRGQAHLEALPPLELKGKAGSVPAWRLVSLQAAAPRPEHRTMVDRVTELDRLRGFFRRVVETACPGLVTVTGSAGLGKSRLVEKFLDGLGPEALVLTGGCQSYGQGTTYRPLVQLTSEYPGGWPALRRALRGEPTGRRAEGIIAGIVDPGSEESLHAGVEEIAWAVGQLFDAIARTRPLVVVWEDLHWAEPAWLDLVENVVSWSPAGRLLTVCVARPELLAARPGWGTTFPSAEVLELPPLTTQDTARLVMSLSGQGEVEAQELDRIGERIVASCDGNPLFAELMLDVMADAGGEAPMPPTVQALLQALADALPAGERDLLERAALIGREFDVSRLLVLDEGTTDSDRVAELAAGLGQRRLVEPGAAAGTFRFTQSLVRDAVYETIPKARRGTWHLRMAQHLRTMHPGNAPRGDGELAFHLEAACRVRRDLRPGDPELPALVEEAADALLAEGWTALARRDLHAAADLIERGRSLLPHGDPRHRRLAIVVSDARVGMLDADGALAVVDAAQTVCPGDSEAEAACRIQRLIVAVTMNLVDVDAAAREAEAIPVDDTDDLFSRCRLDQLWALISLARERAGDAELRLRSALGAARRIGDTYDEDRVLAGICELAPWGSLPVDEGLRLCAQLRERFAGSRSQLLPVEVTAAVLTAFAGDVDVARSELVRALAEAERLRLRLVAIVAMQAAGIVESLARRYDDAYTHFVRGAEVLRSVGRVRGAQTLEVLAARAGFALGREDMVRQALRAVEHEETDIDLRTRTMLSALRARMSSSAGDHEQGLAGAEFACALADRSADLRLQGDVLVDLAWVQSECGDRAAAAATVRLARDRYAAKGLLVPVPVPAPLPPLSGTDPDGCQEVTA